MTRTKITIFTAALGLLLAPALASAQAVPDDDAQDDAQDEDADTYEDERLPVPRSGTDPAPPVAQPVPPGGVVRQAGIGGSTGYGRAGVLELGGSAGFTAASGLMSASLNPSVGWFVADNLQLSGILGFAHISTDNEDATLVSLVVEPSYHLPFTRQVFGFMGLGMGAAHLSDQGFGFALAPRIGANLMVGRSGILSPSLSYQYTTHDTLEMEDGSQMLAVSTALAANIGYTVMW